MSAATFAREFLRNRQNIGAVVPSSPALASCIVQAAKVSEAAHVLELGPGTGPFTASIEQAMAPGARYLGIEMNPAFVETLRHRFPRLDFAEAAAQDYDFSAWLPQDTGFDSIVSGLPWTAFPETLQMEILHHVLPRLAPGGRFTTFAYTGFHLLPNGRHFTKVLRDQPGILSTTRTVWRNFPPAFVYVLERPLG
jgi:phosphatidylethanolamine/phosphatidyl-N-methylethanolamine N-methyltransferase